ncbi:AraC family transcriptional regulator [Flavobacterium sp. 14A]|uniref:helix-turn-helix domain-containing protein n=1 Tax=Flavobacterium sp. 14A TaxID=2735896 RepID=UPI0015704520|nr:AraC family transcriptional regulator [Flavobacterium sp. 14A]NRT12085.1 AraC-like DNA-binding protein [Flavobacterium sp. 14A]
MKNITIKSGNIKDFIVDLKANFDGVLGVEMDEYHLKLDTELVSGTIEATSFQEDLNYFDFDITFLEDVKLNIKSDGASPTYFAYCLSGSLEHRFGKNEKTNAITANQNAVINTVEDTTNIFYFKKDVAVKLSIIGIGNTATAEGDSLNSKIKKTFLNKTENFAHVGIQHITIAQKVQQLRAINQKGIVRNLLKKGLLQIIVAMEIEHHINSYTATEAIVNCLTLKQIEQIKTLSDAIQKDPSEQYSIKLLAQQTGLSPNKLQEGFKLIHNHTVNDFITMMRIEKAEKLIRNTDLNISEIVYSIGFTSRSYFSKIFKEKYNCTPKEYKFSQNSLAITA